MKRYRIRRTHFRAFEMFSYTVQSLDKYKVTTQYCVVLKVMLRAYQDTESLLFC